MLDPLFPLVLRGAAANSFDRARARELTSDGRVGELEVSEAFFLRN